MKSMGIWVFTPYGKGEVLGTRNDGIIVVQLRTSQQKPYLGYFHLSQVRQLNNNADQNVDDALMEDANNNSGGSGSSARVCGAKRGAVDDGRELAPQRVRGPGVVPFTDVVNQMQH